MNLRSDTSPNLEWSSAASVMLPRRHIEVVFELIGGGLRRPHSRGSREAKAGERWSADRSITHDYLLGSNSPSYSHSVATKASRSPDLVHGSTTAVGELPKRTLGLEIPVVTAAGQRAGTRKIFLAPRAQIIGPFLPVIAAPISPPKPLQQQAAYGIPETAADTHCSSIQHVKGVTLYVIVPVRYGWYTRVYRQWQIIDRYLI
jgi:hypothetical protein